MQDIKTIQQLAVENLPEDLANKTNLNLANSPYTTNRILEIPQDIKLELNNGTLTLKAGSKLYDGTGYSWTTSSDMNRAVADTYFFVIEKDSYASHFYGLEQQYCQTTQPTSSGVWFNTSTGETKWSNNGTTWSDCSLPVAIIKADGTTVTIDQVFNGFGYIGSTVFALPNVKCEIPNGRNEDGTCKNIIWTNDSLKTFSDMAGTWCGEVWLGIEGLGISGLLKYIPEENRIKVTDGSYRNMCSLGYVFISSGKISSFTPCSVDSVVNSNASNFSQAGRSYLSGLSAPSTTYENWTLGVSDTAYNMPANGFLTCAIRSGSNTNEYLLIYDPSTLCPYVCIRTPAINNYVGATVRVRKGQTIKVQYTLSGTDSSHKPIFKFCYDEGEI